MFYQGGLPRCDWDLRIRIPFFKIACFGTIQQASHVDSVSPCVGLPDGAIFSVDRFHEISLNLAWDVLAPTGDSVRWRNAVAGRSRIVRNLAKVIVSALSPADTDVSGELHELLQKLLHQRSRRQMSKCPVRVTENLVKLIVFARAIKWEYSPIGQIFVHNAVIRRRQHIQCSVTRNLAKVIASPKVIRDASGHTSWCWARLSKVG